MKISSTNEMINFGADFANKVKNGGIICLYGGLGSGKTTFVQGLAKGLKIKQRIISPTFIIIRSYDYKKNYFYHVDLYRLNRENDFSGLGLEEIFSNKDNIVVIEWADRLVAMLPSLRFDIHFSYSEEGRDIDVKHVNI